jgi:hypothetical protein
MVIPIPYAVSYQTTVRGSVPKLVRCGQCGQEYVYLSRRAKGFPMIRGRRSRIGSQFRELSGDCKIAAADAAAVRGLQARRRPGSGGAHLAGSAPGVDSTRPQLLPQVPGAVNPPTAAGNGGRSPGHRGARGHAEQ